MELQHICTLREGRLGVAQQQRAAIIRCLFAIIALLVLVAGQLAVAERQ
jgi:hypothetical protein